LSCKFVDAGNNLLVKQDRATGPNGSTLLEVLDPSIDDNPRLLGQSGVLTLAPDGVAVDEWVQWVADLGSDEAEAFPALLRILIPSSERRAALRSLTRMAISAGTLYPDVMGAASHANLVLQAAIEDYWEEKAP
jgi:hypothetical protein